MDRFEFARRITAYRTSLGETQDVFGERFGVTQQAVFAWEQAEVIPRKSTALSICRATGMNIEDVEAIRAERKADKKKGLLEAYADYVLQAHPEDAKKMIDRDGGQSVAESDKHQVVEEDGNKDVVPMQDALDMTEIVLKSVTVYRSALWSNIRAFHKAVVGEVEMQGMKEEMKEMKEMLKLILERTDIQCQKKRASNVG
jgi:DNA-binding XRE family transcriptional regulator